MGPRTYRFGAFRLETGRLLLRDDTPVPLGQRALGLLSLLIERRGQTVTKADMLKTVWSGISVSDTNLSTQIWALRRALGDIEKPFRWITTMPAQGYCFIGPIDLRGPDGSPIELPASEAAGDEASGIPIPRPLNRLFGRDEDLASVGALLAEGALITIVGAGGIGKTRLALEIAHAMGGRYRDGVALVDLAVLRDPALVANLVAMALGIVIKGDTPPLELFARRLKGKELLILLDNCEHVIEAVAPLAEYLVEAAPGVRLLATSREPLACAAERVYRLPVLTVPAGPSASAAAALESPAVALLVDRMQAADQRFRLADEAAGVAGDICRRLDGLPLAIEMAAALAPVFGLAAVAERLKGSSRLPPAAPRTLPARHRSLDAMLDWSHTLLGYVERTVLRRLAVFAGRFTLEAAEAVVADETVRAEQVAEALAGLVRKSFVAVDPSGATVSYRLLETIRTYAREKLETAQELRLLRARHARFVAEQTRRAWRDWESSGDADLQLRYGSLIDEMRVALDWCLGPGGDPVSGFAIAGRAWPLWPMYNLFGEGRRWAEAAAALLPADAPDEIVAPVLFAVGSLTGERDFDRATDTLRRAAAMYHGLGERVEQGAALAGLGQLLALFGSVEEATPVLDEARRLLDGTRATRRLGTCAIAHGMLHTQHARWDEARHEYAQAAALFQSIGADRMGTAALYNTADLLWIERALDEAIETVRNALALARRCGSAAFIGASAGSLAGMLIERGALDEAAAVAREAIPACREDEYSDWLFDHLALRAAKAGRMDEAARLLGYAGRNGAERQTAEQRAVEVLNGILGRHLAPERLERLMAEGRLLGDDQATELALRP